jgi:hypothetical protein
MQIPSIFSNPFRIACALALCLPAGLCASDAHTPRLTVPRAHDQLMIDGRADDAAWERGAVTYGFLRAADGKPPAADTRARVLYDRHNLYVAFTALEPDMPGLLERAGDTGAKLEDSVALHLLMEATGQHPREVRIRIDPANQVLVARYPEAHADKERGRLKGLATAVAMRRDSWDAELAIPFAGLGIEPPQTGDVWKVNFVRDRRAAPGQQLETSAWQDPGQFGEVRFGADLLVYLWSSRPFTGRDEVMVYNDSDSLRQLEALVIDADSGEVVARRPIYLGSGHRRQHFPLPAPEAGEYYVIVRQTDRPHEADDDKLVQWRPHWNGRGAR